MNGTTGNWPIGSIVRVLPNTIATDGDKNDPNDATVPENAIGIIIARHDIGIGLNGRFAVGVSVRWFGGPTMHTIGTDEIERFGTAVWDVDAAETADANIAYAEHRLASAHAYAAWIAEQRGS